MTASWADVDAWRSRYVKTASPVRHGRVVFAELRYPRGGVGSVDGLRFVSWPTGDAILALRPCFYVPGRWRSHRRVHITHLRALADEGGTWEGAEARGLLVALDAWLEAGCPKRKGFV